MPLRLAYFLTWTCYGQRVHGDDRGSIDRTHNQLGTPQLPPDPIRECDAHARMLAPPFTLTDPMRPIVQSAIEQLCTDRSWRLVAQNIRPSHAHVIVNCRGELSPERALADLKARATRDLRRAGLVSAGARLWTRHGSTRWLNDESGLTGAIAYVNDWQSGPNREILEAHKAKLREHIHQLREWLRSQGLPEDGRGVVLDDPRPGAPYEPRTQ